LTKQIDSIIHPQYYSNHDRLQKWQQSYELFKQHPITGIGPGDWKVEILQFPAHNSETEFGRLTFQRPHNDYLWILSESGLVTFLFYILLFLISFYALLSLLSKVEDKKTRDWLYCMGIGLVGYSLFSNFGFPKERIETTVLLHILFAGVWAEKYAHRTIAKDSLPIGKFLLILAGLLVGGCLYVGWERAEAERLLRQYEVTKKQHKTPQALALAQQALRPLYQMDPTSIPLPYFSGTCYLELQKLKEAERDLLHALRISPYHIQSMNNLGGCYFQMGKKEKADSMFSRAIHYAPRFEDALMSMAVVEYGKGKVANAVNALTYMCNIDSASTTPKYRSQIQIISDSVSTYLCKSISEPYFQDEIRATLKDRHRYLSIHYRSKGKRPFLTQLYSEALFGLYSSKKITQAEWDSLQVKYKCKILPESK
jgi:tetratricopeptide (TPR) repeat protein